VTCATCTSERDLAPAPGDDDPGKLYCPPCLHARKSAISVEMVTLAAAQPPGEWDRILNYATARVHEQLQREAVERTEAAKGPSLRERLLDLDGLMRMPPPKPLIRHVLDLESESWLVGPPKGFKSFVAIDWACHVALGLPWRGKEVHRGPVLYVAAEGGKGIRKRMSAWIQKYGHKPDQLYVLPMPVQAKGAAERWGDVALSAEWRELARTAAELGAVMVVLDTQARMTVGLDENSNGAMSLWTEAVRHLKEATGACVLVVHHTRKDGKGVRGAGALEGAYDVLWTVSRRGDHSMVTDLRCGDAKDGRDDGRFAFTMEEVELTEVDDAGDPLTSLVLGADARITDDRPGVGTVVEAVAGVEAEGRTWNASEWVRRMLAAQDKDGAGLTNSALLRTINEARKEVGVDPMPLKTFNNNLSRLVVEGKLYRLNAGRTSVHDPAAGAPTADMLREEDEARDRGWVPKDVPDRFPTTSIDVPPVGWIGNVSGNSREPSEQEKQ